ncbi:uncharacterized protein [Vicugna pacos]|uniref:Uncharacterized protein n=1 Tax=Vicugna pacos TaxID=30538 RepID=A0ABM5BP77_VICPA
MEPFLCFLFSSIRSPFVIFMYTCLVPGRTEENLKNEGKSGGSSSSPPPAQDWQGPLLPRRRCPRSALAAGASPAEGTPSPPQPPGGPGWSRAGAGRPPPPGRAPRGKLVPARSRQGARPAGVRPCPGGSSRSWAGTRTRRGGRSLPFPGLRGRRRAGGGAAVCSPRALPDELGLPFRSDGKLQRTIVCRDSDLPGELLYGQAGYLYALLHVNLEMGPGALCESAVREAVAAVVKSGKTSSREEKKAERRPLLYQWRRKQYAGAAHDVAGRYCMLIPTVKLLLQGAPSLRRFIRSHWKQWVTEARHQKMAMAGFHP